jgi:hypothetical protein
MNRQNKHKTVKRRKIINKTVKNNSNTEIQSLRNTYGYVTIPKGMTFYHARDTPYDTNNPDFMLFLTFDVRDWNDTHDSYVTKFVVKKDFDVLFMVNSIDTRDGGKLFSLLHVLLNKSIEHNLNKQYEPNLYCYFPYIVKDNLAGWFCSVENRTGIEIAIYNSNKYLKAIKTVKVISNINEKYKTKKIINRESRMNAIFNKCYGIQKNNTITTFNDDYNIIKYNDISNNYSIQSDKYPITLYINEKYKNKIMNFIDELDTIELTQHNYTYYALQILFKNAIFKFFKNKYNKNMFWNC